MSAFFQSIINVFRSAFSTVRRILVGPLKNSNTTRLPGPELGPGDRKAISQSSDSSGSEVKKPSTVPDSSNSQGQDVSNSQEQVEINKQKKNGSEVSSPLHPVAPTPSLAPPEHSASSQPQDKEVPASSLPESGPNVFSRQEEQELPTENNQLKVKYLDDISILKQLTAESEAKESDKRIPGSTKPDDTDLHQETGPTNPATELATSPYEDNEQSDEQLLDTVLEGEGQTEDSIDNKNETVDKPKRHPTKYKPSIRTPDATKRMRNNNINKTEANTSRAGTFRMHLHVMLGRRNQFSMSLLPERKEDLDEEIKITGPDGQITTWSAIQDEWYCDVIPPNIGDLLVNGAGWESHSEVDQLRWVLTGRDIYVLASSSAGTTSGYIRAVRLILFEDHLVLCTKQQEESVRQALVDAGCLDPIYVPDGSGIPEGWVLFKSVRPTVAVAHDDSDGILTILRPIESVEIVFRGGIRLNRSVWLNAHAPAIFTRGSGNQELEVMIDGNTAYSDKTGKYTVDAWDAPGKHTVFCGGVTQSYELVDATNEWEFFEAFSYAPNGNSESVITVCGPAILLGAENEHVSLVPSENTCLIGAVPGQITLLTVDSGVRRDEYLAVTDFPIVWALPPNPLTCNKSSSYVEMISYENVVKHIDSRNRKDSQNILRWCHAILNASRKQLSVGSTTEEAKQLWQSYKSVARRYWRHLR